MRFFLQLATNSHIENKLASCKEFNNLRTLLKVAAKSRTRPTFLATCNTAKITKSQVATECYQWVLHDAIFLQLATFSDLLQVARKIASYNLQSCKYRGTRHKRRKWRALGKTCLKCNKLNAVVIGKSDIKTNHLRIYLGRRSARRKNLFNERFSLTNVSLKISHQALHCFSSSFKRSRIIRCFRHSIGYLKYITVSNFWATEERLKNVGPCADCWNDSTGKVQNKLLCARVF